MLYNVMLFFHILGTIVMFVAIGITLTAMIAMLYAKKTEILREWAALAVKLDGLLPFSVILILLPGLHLVFTAWGWGMAWVNLSLITLIAMTLMGPIINLRRLKAILTAVNNETEPTPSSETLDKVRDQTLWHSVITMTMLVIAILFLMTVKPAVLGSLIVLGTAILFGVVAARTLLSRTSQSITSRAVDPHSKLSGGR